MKLKLQSQCSTRAYILHLRDEASSFVARLMISKRVPVFYKKRTNFTDHVSYEHNGSYNYLSQMCDTSVLNSCDYTTAAPLTQTKLINSL